MLGPERRRTSVARGQMMRSLLERWRAGTLDKESEAELLKLHKDNFRRRVGRLGPSYFPGTEKNEAAIESLSNGAFVAFSLDPFRMGLTAFAYALLPRFRRPEGILYYWRASATMVYLRREGPPLLRERDRLKRNLLEALKGLTPVEQVRGEPRYGQALEDGVGAPFDVAELTLDVRSLRVPAAVEKILKASPRPLTVDEIYTALERNLGWLQEQLPAIASIVESAPDGKTSVEDNIVNREIRRRVRAFFDKLEPVERRLLTVRGYGRESKKLIPFEEVARRLGGRSKEYYRSRERTVLETFRDLLEPDERVVAVDYLCELLASESTDEDVAPW